MNDRHGRPPSDESSRPDPSEETAEGHEALLVQLTARERELVDLGTRLGKSESARHRAEQECEELRRRLELIAQGVPMARPPRLVPTEGPGYRRSLARLDAPDPLASDEEPLKNRLLRAERDADALRRTLLAKQEEWHRDAQQTQVTLQGLSLEIQNNHQAARELSLQLVQTRAELLAARARTPAEPGSSGTSGVSLFQVDSLVSQVAELREEERLLKQKLAELTELAGAAQALEQAHRELRDLRLQNGLLKEQQADATERDLESDQMRRRIWELEREQKERQTLVLELAELRAKLYSAPRWTSNDQRPESSTAPSRGQGDRNVSQELERLLRDADAQAAVISDEMGFPVVAAGDDAVVERLSALGGEVHRLCEQAQNLLSLSEVTRVILGDRHGLVAYFRFFLGAEGPLSVGTLGKNIPPPSAVEDAVAVAQRLFSGARTLSGVSGFMDVTKVLADDSMARPVRGQ